MESNESLAADPLADALLAEISNWTPAADQGQQDDVNPAPLRLKPRKNPDMAEVKSSFGHDVSNDGLLSILPVTRRMGRSVELPTVLLTVEIQVGFSSVSHGPP